MHMICEQLSKMRAACQQDWALKGCLDATHGHRLEIGSYGTLKEVWKGTCEVVASGKLHQWTESGSPGGNALFRFWYKLSQKKGVNGAINCTPNNFLIRLTDS